MEHAKKKNNFNPNQQKSIRKIESTTHPPKRTFLFHHLERRMEMTLNTTSIKNIITKKTKRARVLASSLLPNRTPFGFARFKKSVALAKTPNFCEETL